MSDAIEPDELIALFISDPKRAESIIRANPEIENQIEQARVYGHETGPYGEAFLDWEDDNEAAKRQREEEEEEQMERAYFQRQSEEDSDEDSDEPRNHPAFDRALKAWPAVALGESFLEERPKDPDWLLQIESNLEGTTLKGFLRMGRVGCLAAPGGTGKTMAAIGLALSVTCGAPWLHPAAWSGKGRQNTPSRPRIHTTRPGKVALLLAEEEFSDIERRAYQAGKMMKLSPEQRALVRQNLVVMGLSGVDVGLLDEKGNEVERAQQLQAVLRSKAGEGYSLILVDPLSRFAGIAAETDNAHATRFIRILQALTHLPGAPAVLFLHHERKGGAHGGSGQEAIRGSSAIVDGARWAARLVPIWEPSAKARMENRQRWETDRGDRALWLRKVKSNYTRHLPGGLMLIQDSQYGGAIRFASDWEIEQYENALSAVQDKKSAARNAGSSPQTSQAEPKPPMPSRAGEMR